MKILSITSFILLSILLLSSTLQTSVFGEGEQQQSKTEVESEDDSSSKAEHISFSVVFTNNFPFDVNLYWKSPTGEEKLQGVIEAGKSSRWNTYHDHEWLFRDPHNLKLYRSIKARKSHENVYVDQSAFETLSSSELRVIHPDGTVSLAPLPQVDINNPNFEEDDGDSHDNNNNNNNNYNERIQRHVTFYNNIDENIELYHRTPNGHESFEGVLTHGKEKGYNVYTGDVWLFRRRDAQKTVLRVVRIRRSSSFIKSSTADETPFHREYERRNGRPWLHTYPRDPVKHYTYPAHRIGDISKTEVISYFNSTESSMTLSVELLSITPVIFQIENFLSESECDHIIQVTNASGKFARSKVGTDGTFIHTRTSANAWMSFNESDVFHRIYQRGFNLMKIPFDTSTSKSIAEDLQVLRYELTQEYQPHVDYFDVPEQAGMGAEALRLGCNRFATLFLYLSDVESGGETVFPRKDRIYINEACREGFRVRPKKGRAILFYSMLADGNVDEFSLHGSCPVIAGTKYAANWWFWDPLKK